MTSFNHPARVYKEAEYVFQNDELDTYPQLSRLLRQGYSFIVLQRIRHPKLPQTRTFALACELICSNGTELLQRHDVLTPEFHSLAELELFIQDNMLSVMHRHFFGQNYAQAN